MRLCPECGKIAEYSSYFGVYRCTRCSWCDDTPNKERVARSIVVKGVYKELRAMKDRDEGVLKEVERLLARSF